MSISQNIVSKQIILINVLYFNDFFLFDLQVPSPDADWFGCNDTLAMSKSGRLIRAGEIHLASDWRELRYWAFKLS